MKSREDILRFTNSVILLSKLLTKMDDRFFVQKLHGKISDVVYAFVSYEKEEFDTSHNIYKTNLVNAIDSGIDFLEYVGHELKIDNIPLLLAQRNLLKFKLHILKQDRSQNFHKNKIEDKAPNFAMPEINFKSTQRIKADKSAIRTDSNKEKIFNFIKRTPDVRTKEIIDQFNSLSGRTVKRNLKELISEGFLKKKSDGIAVYYIPVE